MLVFGIFLLIMLLMQIVVLLVGVEKIAIVKAGDVEDVCSATKWGVNLKMDKIMVKGCSVSTEGLEQFCVHGASMQPFGINDGQMVFISKKGLDKLRTEQNFYPIVMFKYDLEGATESGFKLRKFLTFVDLRKINIDELYQKYGKYLSQEAFKKEIEERIEKIKREDSQLRGNYILSITHKYKQNPTIFHYSLHSVDKLYGIVKYVS